jgi:hypothetical protein
MLTAVGFPPNSRHERIIPPVVTKSGQKEMDFLTVWQASRQRKKAA